MSLLDLIGLANIVGAKEPPLNESNSEETFINFVTNIVEGFSKLPRKEKKQFIKMAEQIAADNKIEFAKQGLSSNGAMEVK